MVQRVAECDSARRRLRVLTLGAAHVPVCLHLMPPRRPPRPAPARPCRRSTACCCACAPAASCCSRCGARAGVCGLPIACLPTADEWWRSGHCTSRTQELPCAPLCYAAPDPAERGAAGCLPVPADVQGDARCGCWASSPGACDARGPGLQPGLVSMAAAFRASLACPPARPPADQAHFFARAAGLLRQLLSCLAPLAPSVLRADGGWPLGGFRRMPPPSWHLSDMSQQSTGCSAVAVPSCQLSLTLPLSPAPLAAQTPPPPASSSSSSCSCSAATRCPRRCCTSRRARCACRLQHCAHEGARPVLQTEAGWSLLCSLLAVLHPNTFQLSAHADAAQLCGRGVEAAGG